MPLMDPDPDPAILIIDLRICNTGFDGAPSVDLTISTSEKKSNELRLAVLFISYCTLTLFVKHDAGQYLNTKYVILIFLLF
jgi:hypothetical protein